MKHRVTLVASAAIAATVLLSGAAMAASRYDEPLAACAAAIQQKLSIAPDAYRQSVVRVSSLGNSFKFTLNVYQTLENGDKKKLKYFCQTRGGEVTALEEK